MRVHLAVPLLLAALLVSPAAGAPRCPHLTDPAGDSDLYELAPDDALDLRSVDIASDGKQLTMVAQVTALRVPPTTSPTGMIFDFQFHVGETYFRAGAQYSPVEGDFYTLIQTSGHVGGTGAFTSVKLDSSITGRFDEKASTVTVHVPIADLNKVVRVARDDVVDEIGAITWRAAGLRDADTFVVSADFADSNRTYTIGAPGCIKP